MTAGGRGASWPSRRTLIAGQNYFALNSPKNTIYWKSDRFGHTAISTFGTMAAILNYQVNNGLTDRNDQATDGCRYRDGQTFCLARVRKQNTRGYGMCCLPLGAQAADDAGVGMYGERANYADTHKRKISLACIGSASPVTRNRLAVTTRLSQVNGIGWREGNCKSLRSNEAFAGLRNLPR